MNELEQAREIAERYAETEEERQAVADCFDKLAAGLKRADATYPVPGMNAASRVEVSGMSTVWIARGHALASPHS